MDTTVLLWAIVASVVPTVFYVVVLVMLDRYEKEPWVLMLMVFLWGAVPAIMLAMVAELALAVQVKDYMPGPEMRDAAKLFNVAVVAPVVEELDKAIALLIVFIFVRKEFDGIMDGLLYGSLAGFGFAMTENFLYLERAFAEGIVPGINLTFLRAIAFGLNHALFCSMFGLGLGIARYGTNIITRLFMPIMGLVGAIGLHMFHNYAVTILNPGLSLVVMWGGVGMWLLLVFAALNREGVWIREELVDEVASGLLTALEVDAAASIAKRATLRLAALRIRKGAYARMLGRLYSLAAELAFKKRQYRIHGDPDVKEIIEELRAEIRELRSQVAS